MTLVSKKARSPLIRFQAVKPEARRQRPLQLPYPLHGLLLTAIASNFKFPRAGNSNFDVVSVFKVQSFDHRGRKADGQAVSPLRYLHGYTITSYISKNQRSF